MKTNDVVAMVIPHVRAARKFLYAHENIYEYKDGIYEEINDAILCSYINAARSSLMLQEEELTRSVKSEIVAHIKDESLLRDDEVETRVQDDLVAFNNGYIDLKELKENNIVLHPFQGPTENPEGPIFFSKIPHNFNMAKFDDYRKKWLDLLIPEHILQVLAPTYYDFFVSLQGDSGVKLQLNKIGYCLLRSNPYKVFFMELGEKDTGKTSFLSLIEAAIGTDNVSHKSMQDISNYSFSAIYLYNKLANIHDDLPRRMITDTGMVKQLTGESPISGHRKFKTDIDFKNYAKLIFATNELPAIRNLDDDAFFSRLVLTIYKNKFERSDYGKRLLTNEDVLEGLLLASTIALRDLLLRNAFADNYAEFADFWKRHINSVYDFVKTNIEENVLALGPQLKIGKEMLYRMYTEYEKEPVTKTRFTQELGRLFGVSANSHLISEARQVWAYSGIGYKNRDPEDAQDAIDDEPA